MKTDQEIFGRVLGMLEDAMEICEDKKISINISCGYVEGYGQAVVGDYTVSKIIDGETCYSYTPLDNVDLWERWLKPEQLKIGHRPDKAK